MSGSPRLWAFHSVPHTWMPRLKRLRWRLPMERPRSTWCWTLDASRTASSGPSGPTSRASSMPAAGHAVKVILECALLTDDEKRAGCALAVEAGAAFVKTSTGYLGHGATIHDVTLIRAAVGPNLGVKASGGILYYEDAVAMLESGATRLGMSHTQQVLDSIPTEMRAAMRASRN